LHNVRPLYTKADAGLKTAQIRQRNAENTEIATPFWMLRGDSDNQVDLEIPT
jgi:hypothetical protein